MPPRKIEKSSRTKAEIAEAARRLFAQHGYERTTVREIAAAANIDPAMVIRYFGSKEELFSSVAEPDLQLPDLTKGDPKMIGRTLVKHFLDIWEGKGGLPVLLRSAASNDEAAERLRSMMTCQVLPAISAVGNPDTRIQRAGLVASQLLGLALTRYVLRLEPVMAMERAFIIQEIGTTIQRYIDLGND